MAGKRRLGFVAAGCVGLALILGLVAIWPGGEPGGEGTATDLDPATAGNGARNGGLPEQTKPNEVPEGEVGTRPEAQAAPERSGVEREAGASGGVDVVSARLRLIVPAYFYPAGEGMEDWNRMIKAASRVPIVAIVNPSSGPGMDVNLEYSQVIRRAVEGGVVAIGYVDTSYGKRKKEDVEADIDRWVDFYPEIKGIFLDAQASEDTMVKYYVELSKYAREKVPGAFVVSNPGTTCAEGYFAAKVADTSIQFENLEGFESFRLPGWTRSYDPRLFTAMPYDLSKPERMRSVVQEAVVKGIGGIYVSDGRQPNPWAELPGYWDAEVEAVRRVNEGLAP